VSDDLGSTTSRGAVLSVMATPTISGLGLTPYWRPGVTDAAWLAAAAGPQLRYQWSVGSTSSQRDVAGATASTFTLPASSDPSSSYICATVSNPVGSARACSFATALTWRVVNPSPTANALTTIARVDGRTAVASDTNGALLRTTDAGATWTTVSDGFAGDIGASRMAFNGQNGISVNGYEGIRLSFDGGRHWAVAPWPDVNWNGVAFTPAGVAVIVGAGGHIRRSSDQGVTWSDAATDTNTNTLDDVAFGGGVGLAVGDGGTIRRSGDGGQTWTTVHVGGPRMNSIAIAAGGTALATDDGGTFWRSTDGGLTWSGLSSGTTSAVDRVHFSPSGAALAGKSFGAILRSVDDGLTWTQVSANTGYVEGFASFDGGVTTAVGGGATLLRSLDDGLTWTTSTTGNTNTLLGIAAVDPSTAVAVGLNGAIRRTADAGDTWSDVASPTAFGLYGVAFGAGANSATGLAVGEQGSILRTVDGGRHWTIVAHAGGLYDYLHTVAWASANVAIAAGSNLTLRSTDGGLSWTVLTPFGSGSLVTGVAFGDALAGVALTSDGRVWHTADGGATWVSVASSSPHLMAVAYSSPTNVTALGLSGAGLHSSDGGLTWTTVNSGFGVVTGYSALTFRDAANGFAVGNNIFEATDGGATWVQQSGAVPEQMNGVITLGAHRVVAVGASGLIYESDSY